MVRIGVLVSGGGTNLQAIIDNIKSGYISNGEIAAVVSSKEGAFALERAKNAGIPGKVIARKSFPSADEYEEEMIRYFRSCNVELIVLAGFMTILSKKFINAFENRIINVHPALIPSFCGDGFYGLKVHEAALAKGVKVTGATVHFVTEETDAGPIILQKAVNVEDDDTPETLQKRVMEQAEWKILPEAVKLFTEGKLEVRDNKVWRKK